MIRRPLASRWHLCLLLPVAVGGAAFLIWQWRASCAAVGAEYYVLTTNPIGLGYARGRPSPLKQFAFEDGINNVVCGPTGLCAVDAEHTLTMFERGQRVRVVRFAEPDVTPIVWLGDGLLFGRTGWLPNGEERTVYATIDAATGRVDPWRGPPVSLATPAPPGFASVARDEHDRVTVTLYGEGHKLLRSWQTSAQRADRPAWVGGRFVVVPLRSGDQADDLWILDSVTGNARRLALGSLCLGVCEDRRPQTVLLGVATAFTKRLDTVGTRIEAVDLATLRRTVLAEHVGEFQPRGLSDDRHWLLGFACLPGDKIGRLDAVRLSDGKILVLQSNVRDGAIAPP